MNTKWIIPLNLLMVIPIVTQLIHADQFTQNIFNTYCGYYPAARPSRFSDAERNVAYNRRLAADQQQNVLKPANNIYQNANGDEQNVSDFAGNYTKGFEHDPVTGVLTPAGQQAYLQLVYAMNTGLQQNFNAITLDGERKLINPQLGLAFTNEGLDSSMLNVPPAPTLSSAEEAAELIELYLMAVCRDVNFDQYGTNTGTDSQGYTTQSAAILNALPAYTGPRDPITHEVTPQTLFRGSGNGLLIGPFTSQFFLIDVYPLFASGCGGPVAPMIGVYQNLTQSYFASHQLYIAPNLREFGVTWDNFITLQNGNIPIQYIANDFQGNKTYLYDGRALTYYAHTDGPISAYQPVINILAKNGFPLSPTNPYLEQALTPTDSYINGQATKEYSLTTFGGADGHNMLGSVFACAFKAAWAQKWRVHRRLRPEEMAGLLDYSLSTSTNPYNLDQTLFTPVIGGYNWQQLVLEHNQAQAQNGPLTFAPYNYINADLPTAQDASTFLLTSPYPELSPTHPAYPSGHATVAGACITVLKALFDDTVYMDEQMAAAGESTVMVNPSNPAQIINTTVHTTVSQELNKLAWNVAMGRNFAGIHWRSDAEAGIRLGEQVAIAWLQDHARMYNETTFTGFVLTTYDGVRIQITQSSVTQLPQAPI